MTASNEKSNERRFSDVRFSEDKRWRKWLGLTSRRRKTINLRPPFYKRYPLIAVFIIFLAALSVFGAKKLFTRAEVADFYPSNCLGSWQSPQNAQGKPEMLAPASASTTFNENNSAFWFAGNGQIFCGNFLPQDYSSEGDIKSVGVTFVWQVGEPSPTSSFPQGAEITTSTEQGTQSIEQGTSTGQATSTEQNGASTQESRGATDAATTTAPTSQTGATSTPPANATSTTSFLRNFPDLLFNIAFAQTASDTVPVAIDVTTTANATAPEPPPALQDNATTTQAPPATSAEVGSPTSSASNAAQTSSQTVIMAPPLQATLAPLPTSTGQETGTEGTAAAAPVPQPPAPDENFLKISYSTDGQTWIEIAKVSKNNWQNFTVTLPIASWNLLKKLQIQIAGIETTLNPAPKVYLDGMFAEVHYEIPPAFTGALDNGSSAGAPQTAANQIQIPAGTPVIAVPPSLAPVPVTGNPQQNTFKASDAPQFNLDLNSLGAPSPASSTPQ